MFPTGQGFWMSVWGQFPSEPSSGTSGLSGNFFILTLCAIPQGSIKYDALDGAFVKTLPLHSSQEILSDTSDGLTVRLRLRITNDFVMALLSRSRSVEVVSPLHLRQRLHDVWAEALRRNDPAQSFKQPMGTT